MDLIAVSSTRSQKWQSAIFRCALFVFAIGAADLLVSLFYIPNHGSYALDYEAFLKNTDLPRESALRHLLGDTVKTPKAPHPYFGYVLNRALKSGVNRAGFLDSREFPYHKKPNEFVVGIFGGSLAHFFSKDQVKKNQEGQENLAQKLKAALPDFFSNTEIVFLNFSLPAAKQPQQFFIATHFLESIDLAINIEGFNEISAGSWAEFPSYFPIYSNFFYSLDPLRNKFLENLLEMHASLLSQAKAIRDSLLRYSSIVYFIWRLQVARHNSLVAKGDREIFSSLDSLHPYYAEPRTPDAKLQEALQVWRKYLLLQNQVLSSAGIPSFYFIQPNQHLPGGKVFQKEEARIVAGLPNEEIQAIRRGYGALLSNLPDLRAKNIFAFDATDIFSKETRIIYVDSCCHINSLGNSLLEDFIVDSLKKNYARWLPLRKHRLRISD